ncbi:hypothetical protein SEUCBS139899_001109 [Sporothrix eucalyptigena]
MVQTTFLATLLLACYTPISLASALPSQITNSIRNVNNNEHLFVDASHAIRNAPPENVVTLGAHTRPVTYAGSRLSKRGIQLGRQALDKRTQDDPPTTHLGYIFYQRHATINVTWGNKADAASPGQTMLSYLSMTESDTWTPSTNYACIGEPAPRSADFKFPVPPGTPPVNQSVCHFGPLYDVSQGNFTNLTQIMMADGYSPDNMYLQGSFVKTPITVSGLTVNDQVAAIVEQAAWFGDGQFSGMLGMGYPIMTTPCYRANLTGAGTYDPFVFRLMKDKSKNLQPVFSLAPNRVESGSPAWADGGSMALGGLVPSSYYRGNFTTVPVEKVPWAYGGNTKNNDEVYAYYATTVEMLYGPPGTDLDSPYTPYNATSIGNPVMVSDAFQAVVDVGTPMTLVPNVTAYAIGQLFIPSATYNATYSYMLINCNAKPPVVAIRIGGPNGTIFHYDPRDLIIPFTEDRSYSHCMSAIADSGPGSNPNQGTIGLTWLKNNVMAVDLEKNLMHFAARRPY